MLLIRSLRILVFFAKVLLSITWWDLLLPHLGLETAARRSRAGRWQRLAASFRTLAVSMGGVMIKVGQFLSARVDVLPRQITDELAGLQDEVQPEPFENIRGVLEASFGCPLEEKYCEFEEAPLASASIGQVHRAHLRCAAEDAPPPVVVKVQRPHIAEIVATDLNALRVVSRWVALYAPIRRRADVPALMEEFSRTLCEEIDYLAEGKNAETFAANFEGVAGVRVPAVFWSHTTRCVLTLEDVMGIKITDYDAIDAAGVPRQAAAERLLDTYLKQIFDDRFFHADPHPGNLFVLPGAEGTDWTLVFVDFGMVGRISPQMLAGLRELLIGVGLQDAARVSRSYQMLGILLPGADTEALQRAAAQVFERFWGKTVPEISRMPAGEAARFIAEFGDLLYEMPFQVPQNFILLGRAMGILSGICSGLNPEFNVFPILLPYARKLAGSESSEARAWLNEAGSLLTTLVSLPKKTEALLRRIEQGKLEVRSSDVRGGLARLERSIRRLTAAILMGVMILAAVQLTLAGRQDLALAAGAGALACLAWFVSIPLSG